MGSPTWRLVDSGVSAKDRAHFYAICAQMMHRIRIDHAKSQLRTKRGGGAVVLSLEDMDVAAEALGISNATLRCDLKVAKAWLYRSLHHPARSRP